MAQGAGDEPKKDEGELQSEPPDLRRSTHEDLGVRVERDLTGSSIFLARGSKTHFSKIHFSARTVTQPSHSRPEGSEDPVVSDDEEQLASAPSSEAEAGATKSEGVLTRIKEFLGL
jgi:hypothetical protein